MLYDLESDKKRWYGRELQRQISERARLRESERDNRMREERESLLRE